MSKNVKQVGNHFGAVDATWVTEKSEPDASPQVPVVIDGPRDASNAEVKPRATRTTVSRNGNGSDSASSDN